MAGEGVFGVKMIGDKGNRQNALTGFYESMGANGDLSAKMGRIGAATMKTTPRFAKAKSV